MSDVDDDEPQLSVGALAALQEFYSERSEQEQRLTEAQSGHVAGYVPDEDWQLSQFWYDDDTAVRLAEEAVNVAGKMGRIACVCAPTVYRKLRELGATTSGTVKCLEFDQRFQMFGADFLFYDYKDPLEIPAEWEKTFDVVIVDPPFLNDDCLCKVATTARFLAKDKLILCTGAVMEEAAKRLLNVTVCAFQPKHANGLQNEFHCFTNYSSKILSKV